ncbi:hypothetical protein [Rufibacter radiotolerans]|uniref:hypothetical protein n=1 Tax=Rufibacter radiotolerans TaxID=1379910 RepID=UPI000A8ECB2D|nr:hypothetical protein [Rufibacter radiotolerans]
MKTPYTLLLIIFLLSNLVAFGQVTRNEEELVKQLKSDRFTEVVAGATLRQEALVSQQGTGNKATVTQGSISSQRNVAYLVQVGAYNNASLVQQGQGNRAAVRQVGTGNEYKGQFNGSNNVTNVLQQGSSNNINQRVEGNSLEYTLIQLGNNNSIHQVETAPSSKPYQVIQQGNNMNITIEQSNWGLPPVTVTRQ